MSVYPERASLRKDTTATVISLSILTTWEVGGLKVILRNETKHSLIIVHDNEEEGKQ
jgi:hypothetical protein